MKEEFGFTPEAYKVNGRLLSNTGRIDRGQAIEPLHPGEIEKPILPTSEERDLMRTDSGLLMEFLDFEYNQPEDQSKTIAARVGNLKLD